MHRGVGSFLPSTRSDQLGSSLEEMVGGEKLPHGQIAERPREAGQTREACRWSGWKIRVALQAALYTLCICKGL